MSTWRKVGYCLIAAVAAFVARAEDYVLPEAPDTQWTIYTTGTYQSGYYDFEDGTGWRFTINSSGSVYLRGLEQTEGTADMLNFQTVPEFPDGRKMLKFMALDLSVGKMMPTAKGLLKAIWLPSTLTALDTSVFSAFSKLEACVFHPDSKPALGNTVFYNSPNLRYVNLLNGMTLGTICFNSCKSLTLVGDLLPNSVTTIKQTTFGMYRNNDVSPHLFKDDKIVIGGDDESDISWGSASHGYFEGICLGDITFGAGVTSAGQSCNTISPYFYNSNQAALTNIVSRNPNGINFNDVFSCKYAGCTGIRQYDLAGFPTGTLKGHSTARKTRIWAVKSKSWQIFLGTAGSHQPWGGLDAAVQQSYWDNFNGGVVGTGDNVPVGLSNAITANGLTLPANIWLVFKPGDWPGAALTVAGDPANLEPEASDPATFDPAYGKTQDVTEDHGESFAATAPQYVYADGSNTLAEVISATLYSRGEDGLYTEVVDSKSYSGDEPRLFPIDTAKWPVNDCKLVWTFSNVAYKVKFKTPLLDDLGTCSVVEPGIRGFHRIGDQITVKAVPNAEKGVTFGEWVDLNGSFEPVETASMRVTMSLSLELLPIFKANWRCVREMDDRSGSGPYWYICDGYWKILFNQTSPVQCPDTSAMTLYPWTTYGNDWGPTVKSPGRLLDLCKPIEGGGTIVKIGQKAFNTCPDLGLVRIPASVTEIRDAVFVGMREDAVVEFNGPTFLEISAIKPPIKVLRLLGECPTFHQNFGQTAIQPISNYTMFFEVPKYDPYWQAIYKDKTIVKRWKDLTDAERAEFTTRFPDEKRTPYGLSQNKAPLAPLAKEWVFRVAPQSGCMLIVR